MKKILTLLGSIILITTTSSSVISCQENNFLQEKVNWKELNQNSTYKLNNYEPTLKKNNQETTIQILNYNTEWTKLTESYQNYIKDKNIENSWIFQDIQFISGIQELINITFNNENITISSRNKIGSAIYKIEPRFTMLSNNWKNPKTITFTDLKIYNSVYFQITINI